MVDAKTVRRILSVYAKAWVSKDPKLILTIFTKNAVYHERAWRKPMTGHGKIKKYWQNKVVEEQSDITFKLLHTYIDGNTAIAEWDARFYDNVEKIRKRIIEVAILRFKGGKIASLKEYWHAETLPQKKA